MSRNIRQAVFESSRRNGRPWHKQPEVITPPDLYQIWAIMAGPGQDENGTPADASNFTIAENYVFQEYSVVNGIFQPVVASQVNLHLTLIGIGDRATLESWL